MNSSLLIQNLSFAEGCLVMGSEPKSKLLSSWEKLGEGVRSWGEHKETSEPIYRKRQRKGSRGLRVYIASVLEEGQV